MFFPFASPLRYLANKNSSTTPLRLGLLCCLSQKPSEDLNCQKLSRQGEWKTFSVEAQISKYFPQHPPSHQCVVEVLLHSTASTLKQLANFFFKAFSTSSLTANSMISSPIPFSFPCFVKGLLYEVYSPPSLQARRVL